LFKRRAPAAAICVVTPRAAKASFAVELHIVIGARMPGIGQRLRQGVPSAVLARAMRAGGSGPAFCPVRPQGRERVERFAGL